MMERDLDGIRAQAGAIDPVITQAADYTRAVRAVQDLAREQGQVMSRALDNNHLLYHTNKKLVIRHREMTEELAALQRRFDIVSQQNEAQARHIAELESAGGDRFRPLYERAIRTLEAHLMEAISPQELSKRLGQMKAQRKELESLPELVTEAELVAMEAIEPPS